MKIKLLKYLVLLILLLAGQHIMANMPNDSIVQDTTTQHVLSKKELRKERVKNRNFHYNILGGPSYTPDYGLLIGGSALFTFRMNPSDKTQLRSVVPVAIALTGGGFNVMSRPQLFFKDDKFRIFGQFIYKNNKDNYYGVGYETNKDYERSKSTSAFTGSGLQVNPWLMFRLGDSRFYAGPQIDITYDRMMDVSEGVQQNSSYKESGGNADGYTNLSSGVGFLLTYDTRDVPSNAYRGIYFDVKGSFYNKFIGSNTNFYKLDLEYRQYKSVGKRKTLAWTVQSKNTFGEVPITRLALSGTPFDLRGYYMGQYRDKTSHVAMIEYRQMINTDKGNFIKRMLNHLGYVAWAGSGFMGPNPVKIEGVLPNFGAGLRIEIQPRMNVRFDVGRNLINKQTLFYFNMTEAF